MSFNIWCLLSGDAILRNLAKRWLCLPHFLMIQLQTVFSSKNACTFNKYLLYKNCAFEYSNTLTISFYSPNVSPQLQNVLKLPPPTCIVDPLGFYPNLPTLGYLGFSYLLYVAILFK